MTSDDSTTLSRPDLRTRILRVAYIVFAAIAVVAVSATLFGTWTIQRSFPQTAGEAELAGLSAEVTVQRDERGIPTITASTTDDLFFAQGFTHAQDRFFEMDFRRHVTAGRVAEMFGESQVAADSFLRALGWRKVAEAEVAALDEQTLGYYEAYAAGVNAYLESRSGAELSLEYAVLAMQNPSYKPEPWEPADSVAWLKAMAWDLRTNLEDEITRSQLSAALLEQDAESDVAEVLDTLYPGYPFEQNPVIVPQITTTAPETAEAPSAEPASFATESSSRATTVQVSWREVDNVVEAVDALIDSVGEGIGSNSWVVSGALTESGMPLLANDPHLGAALPSVWYQGQLRCDDVSEQCPFNVGGFSFAGLPGVVIGHNSEIAWGFTNLTTDVTDLYIERIDGDQYLRDGDWVPLETSTETISVAGGDDVELTIRSTANGPIISGLTADATEIAGAPVVGDVDTVRPLADEDPGEFAVSLRWTALEPGTTASAIFALSTASDFSDFRRAASLFDVPAQNLIYADIEGNIGYQTPGRLPIRGAGDGWMPQPGWDSSYDWKGYIPFDELPVSYNPTAGYIVTANNAIVDDTYDYALSDDWDYGYRAARIAYLIERQAAAGPLTAQHMRDIQNDQEMWIGKRLAIAMVDVDVDGDGPQAAVDLLRTWDAQNTADSAAAAYANVLWSNLVLNIFADREVPLPTGDQGRLFTVVADMLGDAEHPLWINERLGVANMADMLSLSAEGAYQELVERQGSDLRRWNWGSLHQIDLVSDTLGSSGITPIEALFNRGPYRVGGGSSVVNATGWVIGESYQTVTVPSMRMVIDLSDFDGSSWNNLTGTSGHAFHPNYTDQTEDWVAGRQSPWAFTSDAVRETTVNTLTLLPAGG